MVINMAASRSSSNTLIPRFEKWQTTIFGTAVGPNVADRSCPVLHGVAVSGKRPPMTEQAPGNLLTCSKDDCDCLIRVERPCPHGGTLQCGCGGDMIAAIDTDGISSTPGA